jgi:hypothetical protein
MLYVNDLLITKNDIEKIEWIMEDFKQTFEFRSSWHGVQNLFTRYIHDSKNICKKNIEQFGMMNSNPTKLSMIEGTKLKTNMEKEEINATQYRQVVGKLIYLTNSKLDIIYAVNVVNRFMVRP